MGKSRLLYLTVPLLLLLFLSGCGSQFTSINAPPAVEPFETFDVEVSHVYDADSEELPAGGAGIFLTFSLLMPADWTPSPTGTYNGEREGNPFSTEAVLLTQPPTSIVVETLIDDEAPPDVITVFTNLDCEVSPPAIPEGSQLVWYQIDLGLVSDTVEPGDEGTLAIQLTSGASSGSYDIDFQHAFQDINPLDVAEAYCTFYFDPSSTNEAPEDVTADIISATIEQLMDGVAPVSEAVPVPTLAAGMLALLATLMIMFGIAIGRKRQIT